MERIEEFRVPEKGIKMYTKPLLKQLLRKVIHVVL